MRLYAELAENSIFILVLNIIWWIYAEAYAEPYLTFKMELLAKRVNSLMPLNVFYKKAPS